MMLSPDQINALWIIAGAAFISISIRKALRVRVVRGVHWATPAFMSVWGVWELYWYSYLETPWSLAAGFVMAAVGLVWLSIVVFWGE